MYIQSFILLMTASTALGVVYGKCDQRPPLATEATPSENKEYFVLDIENAEKSDGKIFYTPDQTYVLTISATSSTRPFRSFMITAEDPVVDNTGFEFGRKPVDVGSLKTVDRDAPSRYSENCAGTVENADNSDKTRVEIHWVSPKQRERKQQIRIRAMVAENNEVWYTGNLSILLDMNDKPPLDSPPVPAKEICTLCSEARYELLFKGKWSRMAHPNHYPSKPDDNGYSYMIGATHGINFTLWQQGAKATEGLKLLAEQADVSVIEREIIDAMTLEGGTRTLIRGKKRHHPYMFEPSHSLFRVDSIHHQFSIAVAMRPSPDWFLGTSKFELCKDDEWLEYHEMPLYPWDAGTMDGLSYESQPSVTQPVDNVERVKVGSFDRESPFYQMNLNDLQPFAMLEVRRLDVYPLIGLPCSGGEVNEDTEGEEEPQEDMPPEEPILAESRQNLGPVEERCEADEWGDWSACVPEVPNENI